MNAHEHTDPDGDSLTITVNGADAWITCTTAADEVTVGPFTLTRLTEGVTASSDAEVSGDLMDGGVAAALIEQETPTISPDLLEAALAASVKDTAQLARERDEAQQFAALWKETARRAMGNRDLRARLDTADRTILLMKAKKAEQQRDSLADIVATTARQRDEADKRAATASPRPFATPDVDYEAMWWKAETEREHLASRLAAKGPVAALEGIRPLTADDITAEMIERGFTVLTTTTRIGRPFVRELLEAALTESTRPEGAEGLDEWLRQANHAALGGSLDADQRRTLADHLAGLGVRAGGDR